MLAHRLTHDDASTIALHNLGPDTCTVPLRLGPCTEGTRLVDQLAPDTTELERTGRVELELEGYGYRWLRVVAPDDRRLS